MPSLRMSVVLDIDMALAFYTHASNWACMEALKSDDDSLTLRDFSETKAIYNYTRLYLLCSLDHKSIYFRRYLLRPVSLLLLIPILVVDYHRRSPPGCGHTQTRS